MEKWIYSLKEPRSQGTTTIQTFEGMKNLCGQRVQEIPEGTKYLALVWVSGETEYWWLQDDNAIDELLRFYRMGDETPSSLFLFTKDRQIM